MSRLLWLVPILLLLVGGPSTPGGAASPLMAEISGCESYLTNSGCTLGKQGRQIKLWIAGETQVVARVDQGSLVAAAPKAASGGLLYVFEIPEEAHLLELIGRDGSPLRLTILPSQRPAWYEDAKSRLENLDELERFLSSLRALPPLDNAHKLYFLSRLAFQRGRRAEAASLALKGAELWLQAQGVGNAVRELAFAGQQFQDEANFQARREALQRARQGLAELQKFGFLPVRPAYYLDSLEVNVFMATGDLRSALAAVENLRSLAEHGLLEAAEQRIYAEHRALVLTELGRFEEAAAAIDSLLALPPEDPASQAELLMNRGWIAYLTREKGSPGADPLTFFEAAWQIYRDSPKFEYRFHNLLNLAAAELQAGHTEAARTYLERATAFQTGANAAQRLMALELEGRLLLRQDKASQALRRFLELENAARAAALPSLRWQGLWGRSQALAQLGRTAEALETLARAARFADEEMLLIPADRGRETFLAQRDQATRLQLELLLEQKSIDAAWLALLERMTQSQRLLQRDEKLASLDDAGRQRRDEAIARLKSSFPAEAREEQSRLSLENPDAGYWQAQILDQLGVPSTQQLTFPPPRKGELMLTFFPLAAGWVAFARSDRDIVARILPVRPAAAPEELARNLLALFRDEIAASHRLKVVPWGALLAVDFHTLISDRMVVYGVAAGRLPAATGKLSSALLVEAPSGGLRRAADEIAFAQAILKERRPQLALTTLDQSNGSLTEIRQGIATADFLHFAGHSEAKGYAGFDSQLSLQWFTPLRLADLFTLEKVPRLIVLSSCEGADDRDPESGEKGLGLAQAFVLLGADQVLAATRSVNDAKAARLMQEVYERWPAGDVEVDLALLLHEAQKFLRAAEPDPTWEAFRVFEP